MSVVGTNGSVITHVISSTEDGTGAGAGVGEVAGDGAGVEVDNILIVTYRLYRSAKQPLWPKRTEETPT